MSWVFALLLFIYACVWLSLWAQGQLRWLRAPERNQSPPKAQAAPKHLDPVRRELFAAAQSLRAQAWQRAHACARVLTTDPDARLGGVRNAAFRRISLEGAQVVGDFARRMHAAEAQDPALFTGLPDLIDAFDAVAATLEDHAKVVARARALEAFPVAFCQTTRRAFEQAEHLAGVLSDALAQRSFVDPYRPGHSGQSQLATA